MARSMALRVVAGLAVVLAAGAASSGPGGGQARAAGKPKAGKPSAAKSPATAPDLSTPRAAWAAVNKALADGDANALIAASTGDEKELAWARADAAQWRALHDLDAAMAAKYGPEWAVGGEGKDAHDLIEGLRNHDLRNDLKAAKLAEPKGDTALLVTSATDPDDLQPCLVRADGRWRLDLSSLVQYASPTNDTPGLLAAARAAEALTKDVTAGKFATVDAAIEAVDDRLAAAERDAGAAGTAKPDAGPARVVPAKPPAARKP